MELRVVGILGIVFGLLYIIFNNHITIKARYRRVKIRIEKPNETQRVINIVFGIMAIIVGGISLYVSFAY